MTELHAGPTLRLPVEAATKTLAIFGMRESGKSNAAVVLAEELSAAGVPWCALDPVDHWWGVTRRPDGTRGLPAVVVGGAHADVPLEAAAGALLADVVAHSATPVVLCTAELSDAERFRFVAEFATALRRLMRQNRHPLHVFLEEADEFVPQQAARDRAARAMSEAVALLSLRSRQDGVGVSLVTQRPARVRKDLTTQAHALVAFRMTGAQDRAAVDGWLRYHDGPQRAALLREIATLRPGESFLWSPEWLRCFGERVQWRRRATLDAAATPSVEAPSASVRLRPVDVVRLRGALAALHSPLHPGGVEPPPARPRVRALPTAVQSVGLAPSPSRGRRSPGRVFGGIVWGWLWRFGLLGAVAVAASTEPSPPWRVIAAVLGGGVLLGLWRRRWVLARVWRTLVIAGGAVYLAPASTLYPDLLVGSVGLLTLSPLVATWRARR